MEARFIELAGYINAQMPQFVADKVQNALNDAGKPVKGSRIHVMGVAYKRDIDDMRESPALDVMLLLKRRWGGSELQRPPRRAIRVDGMDLASAPKNPPPPPIAWSSSRNHSAFDYQALLRRACLVGGHAQCAKGLRFGQDRPALTSG